MALLISLTKTLSMKQNTLKKDIRDFRINMCVTGIYRDYRLSRIFAQRSFNTNHCHSKVQACLN